MSWVTSGDPSFLPGVLSSRENIYLQGVTRGEILKQNVSATLPSPSFSLISVLVSVSSGIYLLV